MTSKIKALKEPFIITESFLREHLLHEVKKAEVKRIIEEEGIDLSKILKLNLERHYILNITCLWRFTSLETLKLPNNIIEKIEGLDNLRNLKALDLSFNYIERITGLEHLVNLKLLNLTSNEIMVLENMDALEQLETFLIGYNKVKFFDSVLYLREFKNLLYLCVGDNPVIQDENDLLRVIAVLPRLKYLDHRIITKEWKTEAVENFPLDAADSADKSNEKGSAVCRTQADISEEEEKTLVTMQEMKTLHMNAYVDGLINDQLFNTMFKDDTNGIFLISFPPAQTIANEYRMKVELICQEWFDCGLRINEYREKEKERFLAAVESSRLEITATLRQEVCNFISFRGVMLKGLGSIYFEESEKVAKIHIAQFKLLMETKLRELWMKLMKLSALRGELIQEMVRNLLHALSEIDKKYLTEIEKYPPMIEEMDREFADGLINFYTKWFKTESNLDVEFKDGKGNVIELDPKLLEMIKNENSVDIALSRGLSAHLSTIADRIQVIKDRMKTSMSQKLAELKEEESYRYNENTKEVTLFCNQQHTDLLVFFLSLEAEDTVV